tara:strand:+ start:8943 stop:10058 length:1116 start_codon:yes stop_codon:yes gene_type:complete
MLNRKKAVVYIIDGSPAITGAFVCARNIARAIKEDASVVLVISKDAKIEDLEIEDFAAVERLPIRHLRRTWKAMLLYLPSLIISSVILRQKMLRDGAKMLLVNDFYLLQGPMVRWLGYRGMIITWVRINPNAFGFIPHIWLWCVQKTSNKIVSVSRYIESLLPYGLSTDLLYDGVDPKFEADVPRRDQKSRTFVFLGNYIPGKGQDIAIEAFSYVASHCPDARLEFYGGDMGLAKNRAFLSSLKERAHSLGISAKVHFGKFADKPSSIFVGKFAALNLSRSESFSMTVLEASASGLPVIATRSGGPEEIIENEQTGLLIPMDDAQACAEAMLRLCKEPEWALKMGLAGRERVLSQFSQPSFKRHLLELLEI